MQEKSCVNVLMGIQGAEVTAEEDVKRHHSPNSEIR